MSDGDARNGASSEQPATSQDSGSSDARGLDAVIEYIKNSKIEFIMNVTRALTVLCTISYLIGYPGPAQNRYKQALLMNAATSSLRLHARMPPPQMNQLSRAYFTNLMKEDSFHYLIFPLMFFTGQPITLALLPCCLFALFNLATYTMRILEKLGDQEQLIDKMASILTRIQQSLMHTIALSELAMMPIAVVSVFTRVVSVLLPLFYYRFLLLRYNSLRSAHLRLLVSQIKTRAIALSSRYLQR